MFMQTQDAGAAPLTSLMSILFPKEAAKVPPSPPQAQPRGDQPAPKPPVTSGPPTDKASASSSSFSEAMPSTGVQPGQQAAAMGAQKRDRPQPGSAAAARDEPPPSPTAGTDPLGLLQGRSTSPSNGIGPGQGCTANGKQQVSAANSDGKTKEPAAVKPHAAKVLLVAKKAKPRYAPPSTPQPAPSKPKAPAPLPLGPWAAGPPSALQAAREASSGPRPGQPPALPAATAHTPRTVSREAVAVPAPAAPAAAVRRADSPHPQPVAPAPQLRSRMEYRPPALSAAPAASPFPWVLGSPASRAGSQDGAGEPRPCPSAHAFLARAVCSDFGHIGIMLHPCLMNSWKWKQHIASHAHTSSLHALQAQPPACNRCQRQSHPHQRQLQQPGGPMLPGCPGSPPSSAGRLSTRCALCAVLSRASTSSCRAATLAPATSAGPRQT